MATTKEKKPGSKIATREAYGADGAKVTDYKQAVGIRYVHDESGAELDRDFTAERDALISAVGEQKAAATIAFACVGLKTMAGNIVNGVYQTDPKTKVRSLRDKTYTAVDAMKDFEDDVVNGTEWTGGERGEVGAEQVIAAIAELKNKPIEDVRAYWHGGTTSTGVTLPALASEAKTDWRTNDQIKIIVQRNRLRKLEAAAGKTDAPSLGF